MFIIYLSRSNNKLVPMQNSTQVKLLKSAMILGICLLICGHLVLAATFASDSIGHQGFILGAALSAFGVVLSLPTKIYLTLVLMEHEEGSDKRFTRSADGQALGSKSRAHLRTATEYDAKRLAELAERTFRDTFAADNSAADMDQHCASQYSEAIQRDEINDPNRLTLLAIIDAQIVGFAQLRWGQTPACVTAHSAAEIQRLYVDKPWHGKGVAHDLMQTALAKLRQRGHDVVWLGVWEHNPRAIAFYRKLGFAEVGEHLFQLGNDPQRDILMAMPLLETA